MRPTTIFPGRLACAALTTLGALTAPAQGQSAAAADRVYDLVIEGGRVVDPETGLDARGWNVGIAGGVVRRVTPDALVGHRTLDATGHVVAPGFIDPMSYPLNDVGMWYKLADGVTTNLALHGGTTRPAFHFDAMEALRPPIHYGAAYFVAADRVGLGVHRDSAADPATVAALERRAERALREGAMAVAFSLEYYPGTTADEVRAILGTAARAGAPAIFHVRYSSVYGSGGTNLEALSEVVEYARSEGVRVHVGHLHSTGGTFSMRASLDLLARARASGVRVTADVYPYDYWATFLSSARFDPGWQERFQIGYDGLALVCRDRPLDPATFQRLRAERGVLAVAYAIPPADLTLALQSPFVMIGSDGIMEPGPPGLGAGCNNHPRGSGAYARLLGRYVREEGALSLSEALRKASLLPALLLEERVPAMRRKGRLQPGADADLVVFDPHTVEDRSTVLEPARFSRGIRHVVVAGEVALRDGAIDRSVRAGTILRGGR